MGFWSADVDLPAWGGPFEDPAAELFHFPGGVVFHDVVVFAKVRLSHESGHEFATLDYSRGLLDN